MYRSARYFPAGDAALSVELGDTISPEINRTIRNLYLALQKQRIPGVIDLVPSYRSVLVYYDPLRLTLSELEARLRGLMEHLAEAAIEAPKVVGLPTVYGGEYGPDLGYVAEHTGLTPQEVISIHSSPDYLVYMIGFTPGFLYLGGMSERLVTPRLHSPRTAIPAGSVGIAEQQTGVYPTESPGGWRLIGRTPFRLFDLHREPPVVVEPGDSVRFVPVSEDEYLDILRRVQSRGYQVTARPVV